MPRPAPKRPLPEEARLLGKRMVALRKSRNWTQEQLAEAAGLDVSYVAALEVGLVNPTLRNLVRVADGFGVSLSKLFAFTERKRLKSAKTPQ